METPTHLDSHQHFTYLHPAAFEAMLILAKQENIPIRSPKPFINEPRLREFCERVQSRYNVSLSFAPDERASILKELSRRYNPDLRSEDLYLDYDLHTLTQLHQRKVSAEMIIHP